MHRDPDSRGSLSLVSLAGMLLQSFWQSSEQQAAVVFPADGHLGMPWSQRLLEYRKRAPKQWLGLFEPPLAFVEHPKIIQRHSHVGMLRSQKFFLDGQCALVKALGFARFALPVLDGGQVVVVDRQLVMFLAIDTLENLQGPIVKLLGFVVFPLPVQQGCQ